MNTKITQVTTPILLNWNIKSMTPIFRFCVAALFCLGFAALFQRSLFQPTLAGPGHDRGPAAAAVAGAASPRVSAQSDLFELVGIVEGGELKIYLDRFATNEPVTDAKIEVDIAGKKSIAVAQSDGSYSVKSDVFAKPAELALSFTVLQGKEADLLAGDLVIAAPADDHAHSDAAKPWRRWAAYAGGAVLALFVGVFVIKSLMRKRRRSYSNAAALMATAAIAMTIAAPFDAIAHGDDDHGAGAAVAANGNAPKRQSDGAVYLPKVSQRQLGIRTLTAVEATLPKTVELTGRVVADANAGGKVQPTQAGRIEAGPRGLPVLGQAVRKGEVLVVVRLSASAIERANQQSQTTELKSNLELAKKRLARLEQLEGTVPAKDVEAARLEVTSLQQRSATVGASVISSESLVAPVSGVIAMANVVAGQVVDAREVLFEIIDPARLQIEASVFDNTMLTNIASASASPSAGVDVPLVFVGAGRALREGAIPVLFRTAAAKGAGQASPDLAVGQPVKVLIQTKTQIKGFAVPASAVVRNASNQEMVWVHTTAELFVPRPVRVVPLDGATASIVDGLKAGDRVVIQGAPLVNQVR